MDTHDDDLQASWWRTCDFIASAAETILFIGSFFLSILALCGIAAFVVWVTE